jgi:hypothetical protein
MSNLSDLVKDLFKVNSDGALTKVIADVGDVLSTLSDVGGVVGLGVQMNDWVKPDHAADEILAKLNDLYAEMAVVANAENAIQQEVAAADKHARMLAIDQEMAKLAAVQDQLPALLNSATPPSQVTTADMINKCLEAVNYFLPPQDSSWLAVYVGHPYYSDDWSGVLAPQDPGGLVFDHTYTLPSFLRAIKILSTVIAALNPGSLKNYVDVWQRCAQKLEYVHDMIVERGIVSTKIPSVDDIGGWNANGSFRVKWVSTSIMYPYGTVETFSGANNVASYMDEIGYQLLIEASETTIITAFQSLLKLRLTLKAKQLYRQLGLPSVVTASEALRRMAGQPPRDIRAYQDCTYQDVLVALNIADPNPAPFIPDALRGFLSNVPPYTSSGVSSWIGSSYGTTFPPVRTYIFAPRIVRELIETDLRDNDTQLLTEASFTHQTQAWRPVSQPTTVSLQWVPGSAKDGQQLLRVSSPNGSVGQDITKTVMPGESFSFQVWLRTSPGAPSPQNVRLVLWGLGSTSECGVTNASISGEWSLVTVGLDAQSVHDTLRAELYVNNSVDMSGAAVFPAGLTEASFTHDRDRDGWGPIFEPAAPIPAALTETTFPPTKPPSVLFGRVVGPAKDGQQLLRVRVTVPNSSFGQDVRKAVFSGESYSFRIWLRTSPGTPSPQNVTLALWGLGSTFERGATAASVTDEWSLVTVGLDAQFAHDTLRAEIYITDCVDMSGARLIGIP